MRTILEAGALLGGDKTMGYGGHPSGSQITGGT